ncbi:lysylphosphatidylglycerol synthase transmembrane domain-containing protein [Rhizobium jaguaris]|uniref:lysylphosphatidylglycerol synthase transmembrane domain-containing protein n=1 Tax=Rhizobium jaguaris TaxID=1312183 RepID=UPI0039BF596F
MDDRAESARSAQQPPYDVEALSGETSTISLILGWGVGLIVLAGLISFILHYGDITIFIATLKAADPLWLAIALVSQAATYACAAAIWATVMAKAGFHRRVLDLLGLAVVELFANQAIPTGGLSGSIMVVRGLLHRSIPSAIAVTALLIAALSYYAAYLLMAIIAFILLWHSGELSDAWLSMSIAFAGVIVLIAGILLLITRSRGRFIPRSILDWRPAKRLADVLKSVRHDVVGDGATLAQTITLQATIFLLDAVTLWLTLRSIGMDIAPTKAFVSFILASVVATLSPVPLGLGSFEGTCVGVLHLFGVQAEAALAATLIFRGFTFWLPMLPGLWLIRRETRAVQ